MIPLVFQNFSKMIAAIPAMRRKSWRKMMTFWSRKKLLSMN